MLTISLQYSLRQWYEKINLIVVEMGFIKMKSGFYILCVLCLSSSCHRKELSKEKPLVKVETAEVMQASIPIFLEGIGHVRAFNYAQIRAQVEGRLMEIHYEQGATVNAGDLLVTIDPRPYEAKVQEADGAVLESQANLRFAEEKVMRYTKLVKDDYVSKIDYDQYVTSAESLLATIKKNEGFLKEAKVNLDYCYIKAPFAGRIGKKLIDVGNLIDNSGDALLTIHQTQPIYVDFSIPEKYLVKVLMSQKKKPLEVKVHFTEGIKLEELGSLIVIDNSVDLKTGMIPMRAQFLNEKGLLWPGQFTKVRLVLKEKTQAILAPEGGLNFSQKGYFAYVVDLQNKVSISYVKVGEKINSLWEILEGLKEGDRIITNGQFNVNPEDVVDVVSCDKDFLKQLDVW